MVLAVHGNDLRLFRLLVEKGVNHQVCPFHERTMLSVAVVSESLEVLRFALDKLEWDDMINAWDDEGRRLCIMQQKTAICRATFAARG